MLIGEIRSEGSKDFSHEVHVTEIRYLPYDACLAGEKRGCQNGQDGIFGPTDFDVSAKRATTLDQEAIHDSD